MLAPVFHCECLSQNWQLADGVEPTKLIAFDFKERQQPVNGYAVAMHHVENAIRKAGLLK